MNNRTIKVCPNCETPLIFTFLFAYSEFYCLNCGYKHGMLGAGKDVKLTKELKLKDDIVQAIWKQLHGKGRLLASGNYQRSGCKKCTDSQRHNSHLSKREKEWNEVSTAMLEQLKGSLNRN